MKNSLVKWTMMAVACLLVLGCTAVAFASEGDASYFLDAQNILYIWDGGTFVPVTVAQDAAIGSGTTVAPANIGFGESSANWRYSQTDNGYTVKHKGWKERKSAGSLYGVRACCTTVCTPAKTYWNEARMTDALGFTILSSGQNRGWGGTRTARSGYQDVHIENACMRSTWGNVGKVIKQW